MKVVHKFTPFLVFLNDKQPREFILNNYPRGV